MRMYSHNDMTLACGSCGETFIFSAGEQELLRLRGISRLAEHCPPCTRQTRLGSRIVGRSNS